MKRPAPPSNADPSNLFCFYQWLEGRNLTRTTGYRYRQRGLINTVNIFGRLYITRQEIENFEQRALNGDFHQTAKTPVHNNKSERPPTTPGRPVPLHAVCTQPEGFRCE